jgi:hypothetical protein
MSRACIVFAAAGLSLAGWSFSSAQELRTDSDQSAPKAHRMERNDAKPQGQTGTGRTAADAEAQSTPGATQERKQPGVEREKPAPERGTAQGASPPKSEAENPSKTNAGNTKNEQAAPSRVQSGEAQKAREGGAAAAERSDQGQRPAKQAEDSGSQNAGQGSGAKNGAAAANSSSNSASQSSSAPAQRTNEAATGGASGQRMDPRRVHAVGGAKLSQNNAAQIATALLATSQPKDIHIAVNVGAPVPGDVDLEPLPPNVVDIVPEYRGYEYAVANDEVVIIEPSTRKVVEVISESGETAENGPATQTVAGSTRVNPCGP